MSGGMRAVVQDRYGPVDEVLHLREVPVPEVADDEVLVRVRAASVHPDIWHVVTGRPYVLRLMGSGVRRPQSRIPGTDLAGQVESVGRRVTRFRVGDEVFGESLPGFQWRNGGTFAEFVAVQEEILAAKPPGVTFEEAATLPTAGIIAVHNLRYGERLVAGQEVLVNGAGGGVGSIAVQLAKAAGARVTGVDAPHKLELLRSLGADQVVDYTCEDFTRSGRRYDLIFDVASNLTLPARRRALAPGGIYVLIGHDHFGAARGRVLGTLPQALGQMALSPLVAHLPRPDLSPPRKREAMAILRNALEAGQLTPAIDRAYPLEEAGAALRRLASGDAVGRIVVIP
ncbi:MAG: NAD(P)-dependent alcohol dehydrogenase [Gemmatimonadota bacterium]